MAEETLFNKWDNVVAEGRNELVFEHKHKDYGAYQLRRNYNRTVGMAVLVTSLSVLFIACIPAVLNWLESQETTDESALVNTPVALAEPPPVDPNEPPPPPPPPPPVMETVKFVPPVVEDEKVEEPQPIVTQETEVQVAEVTQEGTGEEEIIITEGTGTGVVEPVIEAPLTIVEQMPTFPGGEAAMMKWIKDKIEQKGYPQMEKEAGISGTCYVTFVVEKDGNITDVKLLRGVSGGPGYNKLAQEVVKEMPNWKAGKQNGREVRVQFNLPIKFTLK